MIGKTISHYKILEKLGEGGMGVVYKAEDTNLKRTVALKFLSAQAVGSEEDKKRFVREAQAAAALDHANICTVHEIDEADGQTFIAMAYLDGQSLKDKIEERPLKLDEALDLAMQVADGLHEAHENGIVHRDIKSSNIMVTAKGQAKIMDFGLARQAGKTMITKEGTSMGTVAYMSPEQAQGVAVDHRTDIWSFGVMLYEMVTGQLPFKGDYEQAVVYSIMNEEPEPMTGLRTGVPMELERIVNKAMAKNPEERYQNVNDMLIDLRSVAKELEVETSKTRVTTKVRLEKEEGVSLFKDLLQRRVPQILGLYFGASFVVIQFVEWLVNHYPLSPHLEEFSFVALASMVPTVLFLAYFHGKPGRDKWTRVEKVGIPVNLLVAAVLLFFIFQGKDLGAATKTVTLKDEEGKMIDRVIPKNEFRKRVAIFYFENESGDSTYNWLQYGLAELVEYDLDQDLFLHIHSGYYSKMKEAGYEEGTGAPLTLKKKIAGDSHLTYFVTGSFTNQNDTLTITTKLYETKKAKLIAENPFSGADIFQSVDAMTVQLKHDLEIPAYHIEQTEDLPVSEILTNSISAYRMRIAAMYARLHDNDYNGAAKHLEKAVEEDPFFAYAHYRLYRVYAALNQRDHAERAISTALQHKHNLPERYQFWVKNAYYRTKEEMQQVFENAKNWVALYPETTDGHHILANQYENMNQFNEAIEEHRRIFELDPEAFRELHHIGALYKAKGEFEEALKYYGQYAEIFPKEYHSFEEIGDLYQTMGDYEGAKSNYKKARLMEPEEISILSRLGMIEIKLGNFRQALEQYQDALKIAKTPQDRSTVYAYLADYSTFRGQIRKALEYYDFQFAELEKFTPPQGLLGQKFMVMANYALIGKEDEAFRILKGLEAQQLMPPFNLFPSLGYLMVYMVLEDADKAEKAADEFESFIEITKLEVLRPILFMARGQIHEFREEYTQAIEYYEKAYENAQPEMKKFINLLYGESYRELKEFEKAEEYIHQTLKIEPFLPDAHYEIALVYYDMGKKEKALEHLKKALYVWEEADPEFKPAKEAREKLAEWEPVTSKM